MNIDELTKLVKEKDIILGTDRVLKLLKTGGISKVLLAKNTDSQVSESIRHYAGLSSVEVEDVSIPNDELGVLCKKPFSVSVIGVAK